MDILTIKYSSVDLEIVKNYMAFEEDFTRDDVQLVTYIYSAKSLIEKLTGKDSESLDNESMATVLLLKTVNDFYHNRMSSVSGIRETQLDPMFQTLIDQLTDFKAGGLV